MLDLRRLRLFHAVATHGSFSAAALELSYTQSSVSEAVLSLERELGMTLLDRSRRPVRPTPAGETVLGHVEVLLGRVATIEEELAALSHGDAGRLRVAGFYTAWSTFLPRAIAAFSRSRPAVKLELEQLDPPAALHRLRSGELDLAVIYRFEPGDPAADPDDRFVSTWLSSDPYALAIPAKSPLARKRPLAIADLESWSWCMTPPGSAPAKVVEDLCREHGGFEPRIDYPTYDVAMAQPLVAAGLAVSMLPALNLQHPHPGVAVRALPQAPFAREIWALERADRRLPAARAMIEAISMAAGRGSDSTAAAG